MEHYYGFVDQSAVDPLWSTSWRAVARRYPNRWIRSSLIREHGAYTGESLRALLEFSIDDECDFDAILEHGVVRNTLRFCRPQFWTMAELIENTLPKSAKAMIGATISDVAPIVRTGMRAFHDRRISARTLWAVIKLHSVDRMDPGFRPPRRAKLPYKRMWEPVYAWQGTRSFSGDEWTNCLKAGDTQRFIHFLARAYRENWPTSVRGRPIGLREIEEVAELVEVATKRVPRMTRPFVYRMWE